MRRVEKPSFFYNLLFRLVKAYFHIFHERVTITGKDRIPAGVPVIFAANHQNALMDALAVLFAVNRPVVFLARADIFKNKRIARLLNFLRILPVFRIRDGIGAMGNNAQTFGQTVRVLQSGTPLGILPEGSHSPVRRLQTLKKGICRIAFQAAEHSNYTLNIHLVPIGLDYTNHRHAGTHLLINIGEPVDVSAYYGLYREHPQKALAMLRDDLAAALRNEMIHVEHEQHYRTIWLLTGIVLSGYLSKQGKADNRVNRFTAAREIISQIEQATAENRADLVQVSAKIDEYLNLLSRWKLKDHHFQATPHPLKYLIPAMLLSFLAVPLHLYGMLINYLPYKIPVLVSRKLKDPQFIASVNFGLSFLLFPLWYLLLLMVQQAFAIPYYADLLLFLSWPAAGIFTFYHYRYLRKLDGLYRLWRLWRKHPDQARQIAELRQGLAEMIRPN